jgi:hypothetical protein
MPQPLAYAFTILRAAHTTAFASDRCVLAIASSHCLALTRVDSAFPVQLTNLGIGAVGIALGNAALAQFPLRLKVTSPPLLAGHASLAVGIVASHASPVGPRHTKAKLAAPLASSATAVG